MSDTRVAVAGLALVLVAGGAAVFWFAAADPAAPPPVVAEPVKPIPVRDDGPYRPRDFQLSTADAIRYFEDRIRTDPESHLDMVRAAGLYMRKARADHDHSAYDKADEWLVKALQLVPTNDRAKLGRAAVASARHRFADGLVQAEALLKENPQLDEAKAIAADALLELGRYDEAAKRYDELAGRGSPPPALLARRARLAELHGDPAKAAEMLATAIAQRDNEDRDDPRSWYRMRRGEILLSMGKLDEATAELTAALADQPDYPAALQLLGRTQAARGRYDEAIKHLEAAAKVSLDIPTAAALEEVYRAAGKVGLADVHAKAVESLDVGKPEYARELAVYYADRKLKPERAVELARIDFGLRQDIYAHDILGWALARAGKPQEAEPHMIAALKLGTKDAVVLLHAAVVQSMLGRPEKAKELLARSTAANPHLQPLAKAAALGK